MAAFYLSPDDAAAFTARAATARRVYTTSERDAALSSPESSSMAWRSSQYGAHATLAITPAFPRDP